MHLHGVYIYNTPRNQLQAIFTMVGHKCPLQQCVHLNPKRRLDCLHQVVIIFRKWLPYRGIDESQSNRRPNLTFNKYHTPISRLLSIHTPRIRRGQTFPVPCGGFILAAIAPHPDRLR